MKPFRQLRLLKVEETAPGEIALTWADGSVSRRGFRELRMACQCAACRDELTGKRLLDPEKVPTDVRPDAIDPVGGYALRFVWSDGHRTGIFPFAALHDGGGE